MFGMNKVMLPENMRNDGMAEVQSVGFLNSNPACRL